MSCDRLSGFLPLTDDRVPLCYQYLEFAENYQQQLASTWDFSNPVNTSWEGIKGVSNDGRVTIITIAGVSIFISGSRVAPELGNLSSLTRLRFENNGFIGEIPSTLGNLSSLTLLRLEGNNFIGEIPLSLVGLSELEILDLGGNDLGGEIPDSLGSLTNLITLNLDNNNLSGEIPDSLGSLTNLTALRLDNNNLSGEIPDSLGSLSNLTSLRLNNNRLIGEIPSSLGNNTLLLPEIRELDFSHNNLSGAIPDVFKSSTITLRTFRIDNNSFSPDDLASFTGGYGTRINGWYVPEILNVFSVSPQHIVHPEGDTLYYDLLNPYIVGLRYTGESYNAEYGFLREGETEVIQSDSVLRNPTEDSYSLTTTLRSSSYGSSANELVFTASVSVVNNNMLDLLDENNKPRSRADCDGLGELLPLTDDRVPLCYQYLGFAESYQQLLASTWDFSNLVNTSWQGIEGVSNDGRVTVIAIAGSPLFISGSRVAPELGNLSSLTSLRFENNGFIGEIPSTLGNLSNLITLRLDENSFIGEIPSTLGNLSNLITLRLNENNLSGEIPDSLGSLSNLTTLDLGNNNLSGEIPDSLGSLSNLTTLRLNNNRLRGLIPSSLGNTTLLLPTIRELDFSHNNLSGAIPDVFKEFPATLRTFRIDNNSFSPDDLASFTGGYGTIINGWYTSEVLTVFSVSPQHIAHPEGDTLYYGLSSAISGLIYSGTRYSDVRYEFIREGEAPIVQVGNGFLNSPMEGTYTLKTTLSSSEYSSDVNELVFSTEVSVLSDGLGDLYENNKPLSRVSCDTLSGLINDDRIGLCYQYISFEEGTRSVLSNWDFSDSVNTIWTGIDGIDNKGKVTALDLSSGGLSGVIASELGSLSKLERLNISDNNLSDTIPSTLGSLSNLTDLQLDNNNLSGLISDSLRNLSALQTLRLNNNSLIGEIPSWLGSLSNLTDLRLSGNSLSGLIPSSLGNLSSLTDLQLDDNNLNGLISDSLRNLSALQTLRLNNNSLVGEIPSWLGSLSSLTDLRLSNNSLSGLIPSSLGNLSSLENLWLNNNNLSGEIPSVLKTLTSINDFRIDNNGFLPDDLGLFVGGYGTNVNEWSSNNIFDTFNVSPQQPIHPQGDTLYYGVASFIRGLAYSGIHYNVVEYEFFREGESPVVQVGNALLNNPTGGMYSLRTTLRSSSYGSGANELVFSTDVSVMNDGLDGLYANNKPINRVSCDRTSELIDDDRVPLCYQYLSFSESSRSVLSNWNFYNLVSTSWTGVSAIDTEGRITEFNLSLKNLSGEIAAELSGLSNLEELGLNDNNLSGPIPSSLGDLSNLQDLRLHNNKLSGPIPNLLKTLDLIGLRLDDNKFLPDDLGSFVEGYGTNNNGWSSQTINDWVVSPQQPSHPQGDTLYYNLLNPFIRGLTYSGDGYSAEYRFTPSGGSAIVQAGNDVLTNPSSGSYTLQTTLSSSAYGSGANQLVFNTEVSVLDDGIEILDANNKPINRASCDILANVISDDRVPLCYQYLAFEESSRSTFSSWDFSNPVSATGPNRWAGILEINDDGRITIIRFSSSGNISGTIAAELGGLPNMHTLDFTNSNFSGAIPDSLGSLSSLVDLLLEGNNLSDSIPSSLGNLSNMRVFHLQNNNLSGEIPASLGNISRLEDLRLENNNLSGAIPPSLGNLSRLQALQLSHNSLSGAIPPSLGNLSPLQTLQLNDNSLSDSIPSSLGNLSQLTTLVLSDNNLSGEIPSVLGDLPQLTTLVLSDNNLSGEIPSVLGDLSQLRTLSLSHNNFSGEIPSFLQSLSGLTTLSLSHNNFSGEIPSFLQSLSGLTTLSLSHNNFSGEIPSFLQSLSRLRDLELNDNSFSGEIPSVLGNLPQLTTLSLSHNNFSGEIPSVLGNLPQLTTLSLSHNNFSGEIPSVLGNLPQLTTLSLSHNNLSGSIPNNLKTLSFNEFQIDNNMFLPDDLGSFVAGYGTNDNGWSENNIFDSFQSSPQNPAHPEGDTLYYGLTPYINGLAYNGNGYSTEYVFTLDGSGSPVVQVGNAQLDNPTDGTYSLMTTLRKTDSAYASGANELIFSTEVAVVDDGLDMGVLDANNKPINRASCDRLAAVLSDDRVPLCYQYVAFDTLARASFSSWDFSAKINANWTRITINNNGQVRGFSIFNDGGFAGTLAPELGELSHLQFLSIRFTDLRGSIPSSLGNLSNLVRLAFDNNNLSGTIPSSLGNLSNLQFLYLDNNILSGVIPSSLGNLSNLEQLNLANNNLNGPIPDMWKTSSSINYLRLDNNAFLPNDLAAFAAGYGVNENGWSVRYNILDVSPQNPAHPEGDTLYFGGLFSNSYITGFPYSDNLYDASYSFAPAVGNSIVQSDSILNNPTVGSYTLTTTLRRSAYERGASTLIFNTQVVVKTSDVLDNGMNVLDENNKPTSRAACVRLGELIDDDRVPLCYQYLAFDDTSRSVISNWDFSSPTSTSWTGIGRISNGRVVEISLQNKNLAGTIAPELGNLTNLRDLYLYQNNLRGPIPSSLENLSNLQNLWIYDNNLSDSIPASLGNLPNLSNLELNENNLSGEIPSALANLSSLVYMNLNDNNLSGEIPSALGNLSNLQQLSLNDNNLSGKIPASLGNLTQLRWLYLNNDNLNGEIPPSLGNLTNLTHLGLDANNLSGEIPDSLGNLSKLVNLNLSFNNLSGSIPASLGNLSKLTHLWLYSNNLSGSIPASLGNLSKLQQLFLNDNNLSGEIPASLKTLTSVNTFGINNNTFSPDDLAAFVAGYGTNDNGWSASNTFGSVSFSPQSPSHPEGDTLVFGFIPYITGLAYRGNAYSTEYTFTLEGSSPIVQSDSRLNNPTVGNYTLRTRLSSSVYGSGANELNFSTEVVVVSDEGLDLLDANNKPTSRDDCDVLGRLVSDDRVPLCYQYLAIEESDRLAHFGSWDFSAPISNWQGITLDDSGRVRVVNISGGVTGTLAPELGNLSNLVYLDANNLSGVIPASLGNLSKLRFLYLDNNNLSGVIPASLGNLSNLTGLQLNNNNLSGVIPASLGNLSNLTGLQLNNNNLSGVIPASLGNLSKLTGLQLNNNNLSGVIPASLGNLSKLTGLQLNNNNLSGSIPDSLENLSNLFGLYLHNNSLSGEIPASLSNLYYLTTLHLSNNNLSGEIPASLSNLSNLTNLHLSNNNLSGEIPASLGNFSKLTGLQLNNNNLSGEIPASLGNFSKLRFLYLNDNNLSGEIPESLGNLSNIKELYLQNNNLSDSIPNMWKSLHNIESIRIDNNEFSPDDLARFTAGYGTDDNGWKTNNDLDLGVSPQRPSHPEGDTLFFGVDNFYITGLVYNGDISTYDATYEFIPEVGSPIVQEGNAQWNNPKTGTYTLRTTLSSSAYSSGANELVFTTDVFLVGDDVSSVLDENNKPISLNDCDRMAGFISDDRIALCYQYFAFEESARLVLSSWDFSDVINTNWTGIDSVVNGQVVQIDLQNRNLEGIIAPELGRLSNLQSLYLQNNNLSGSIPGFIREFA